MNAPNHSPFWSLPRELRDEIYDMLETGSQVFRKPDDDEEQDGVTVYIHNALSASCLLVSKQFGQEYKERQGGRGKLLAKDDLHHDIPSTLDVEGFPKSVKKLEMHLVATNHDYDETLSHSQLLRNVVELLNETLPIVVEFYVTRKAKDWYSLKEIFEAEEDQIEYETLAKLPGVSRFRIWSGAWEKEGRLTFQDLEEGIGKNMVLLGTWDEDDGKWKEPDEES